MGDCSEIGSKFGRYLARLSPQVKNDSLQYYLSGSLATTLMSSAESINEVILDEQNNVIGEKKEQKITDAQRERMKKFCRKLGVDIDVVDVNGDLFRGAPLERKPSLRNVRAEVPDILELMSWTENSNGSGYIDTLNYDRTIEHHPVSKIRVNDEDIYITAPPEQLAHKISETITLRDLLVKSDKKDSISAHYEKDIRDLASMFYGFEELYSREELFDRVYRVLIEKNDSLFPITNTETSMEWQKKLEGTIMSQIISDSQEYLDMFAEDETRTEIGEFLSGLVDRRKTELLQKNGKIMDKSDLTPLQQREVELSQLEEEARSLIQQQTKEDIRGRA